MMMQFHNPDGYELDDQGTIRTPGKYEAELVYVPYFAESDGASEVIDGAGDQCPIDVYTVEAADRAKFPGLLDDVYAVALQTSDQGFCDSREFATAAELDQFRAEVEAEVEAELNGEDSNV